MTKLFLTGGHATTDDWLVVFSSEFTDEGAGSSTVFFVNAADPGNWHPRGWSSGAVASTDIATGPGGTRALCVVSDQGAVSVSNRNGEISETIEGAGLVEPNDLGYISDAKSFGSTARVCGMSAQLYERQNGNWIALTQDLMDAARQEIEDSAGAITEQQGSPQQLPDLVDDVRQRRDFTSLSEGPSGETLLCGMFGLVARLREGSYDEIRLEPMAGMTAIYPDDDARIVTHGWRNRIFYLFRGTFEDGFELEASTDLMGNASTSTVFQGSLYVAGQEGFFRYVSGQFIRFNLPLETGVTKLVKASDDFLWIIGHYDVLRWDGETFEKYEQPT